MSRAISATMMCTPQLASNQRSTKRVVVCKAVDRIPVVAQTENSWLNRKATVAAAILAASLSFGKPVFAQDIVSASTDQPVAETTTVEPIYFGNGCFWGRQYDFINTEKSALNRSTDQLTATVGYAGGRGKSPDGKVCYYYTKDTASIYERLGHAEVVKVDLAAPDESAKQDQFRKLAKTYFADFRKLKDGRMLRLDPQDEGPGYRNVIGLPGGTNSPLFKILQEENVNNMDLLQGKGNEFTANGRPTEDDVLNTVWVLDSNELPFYQAEKYHQYHNGLGKKFPTSYTKDLKEAMMSAGKLQDTGCPEYFFLGS